MTPLFRFNSEGRVIDSSWPICTAVAALVLGVIGMGLWIDWKLNRRKKGDEPRQARGFEVLPTQPAPQPHDEAGQRRSPGAPAPPETLFSDPNFPLKREDRLPTQRPPGS